MLCFVQIREELRANGIDVYPQKEFDEDADDRKINDKIRVSSVVERPPVSLDITPLTNVYFAGLKWFISCHLFSF